MDRLQKIKGYADRAPRADVLWLVGELEEARTKIVALERQAEEAGARAARLASRMTAEGAVPKCPCQHPESHAGWCPRRPETV